MSISFISCCGFLSVEYDSLSNFHRVVGNCVFHQMRVGNQMSTRGEDYEISTIRSRNFCMILWHGRREDGDEKLMDVKHRLNILIF